MRTENQERKHELRTPSRDHIMETLELVELGKKAKIVFHDLSNHITTLTLSIGNPERIQSEIAYITNLLRSHIEHTPDTFFNPAAEISKITEAFSEKTHAKRIRISLAGSANTRLFGSISAFIHIITNLVSNAIDSFDNTPEKRVKEIKVRLHETRQEFFISFSDTGCGIEKSIMEHIFEPKFTTKSHGHGIGLWATKEYVEQKFNGKISVKSSGNGTIFTLTFPSVNKAHTEKPATKNRKQILFPAFSKTTNVF